ncbi:MAG TPA: hypothetical protein VLC48_04175, partial [Gemmatimonadota bacterium]|nr:hypothetical protein [Gemmatimonadota bacterium]
MRRGVVVGLAFTVLVAVLPHTGMALAQSGVAEPVTPEQADAIRDTLQRPPAKPPFDAVDAVALPFKILFLPLRLVGLGFAELAGLAIQPDPKPIPIVETLKNAGVRAGFGSIGPRSGFALRLGYGGAPPFFLESAVSIRLSQRHRAGFLLLGGSGQSLEAAYTFWRNAAPHFYGIGIGTRKDDERDFLWDQQTVSIAGSGLKRIDRAATLAFSADLAYEDNRVDRGRDGDATDIQDDSVYSRLYGVGERVKYVRGGASLGLDLTYSNGLQRRGLSIAGGYQYFRGVADTDSDFQRFDVNVFGYLPLNSRQQLAFQVMTEANRSVSGEGVPFYHLASLGSEQGGRAYHQLRFRDLAMAAFMVEWRWEVWRELHERSRIESFLFYDSGSVAESVLSIQFRNMRR